MNLFCLNLHVKTPKSGEQEHRVSTKKQRATPKFSAKKKGAPDYRKVKTPGSAKIKV